ncbi:MAG: hypothetical protein ACOC3F_02780, partial [Desulfosudaceae bacterium]
MTIGNKITLRILIGLLVLIIALTTAIAFLIYNQNRQASGQTISRTFNIIRENIISQRQDLLDEAAYVASAGDMGTQVQFLSEEKENANTILTESSFKDVADSLYSTLQSSRIYKIAMYDMDGDITAFAVRQENRVTVGYPARGQDENGYYTTRIKTGEKLGQATWTRQDTVADIQRRIDKQLIPDQQSARFISNNKFLNLTAMAPCTAPEFNEETGAMEQVQVGLAMATQRLDQNFVDKLAALTDTEINVFVNQRFSVGTLTAYASLSRQ